MKKVTYSVLFLAIVFLVNSLSNSAYAEDQGIRVGPYVFTYNQTFRSAEITIQFDVDADTGSEIPCMSETGGVYSPVFVTLQIGDIFSSGSIHRFFSSEKPCVAPYVLFHISESEYEEIARKDLSITLNIAERPYQGKNWNGEGHVFLTF